MIPKNITKSEVILAIQQIDREGIPKTRLSRTYNIEYNNKFYPHKYVISLANKIANGCELKPEEFGGGEETNSFLEKMGFKIVPSNCHHSEKVDSDKNKIRITTVSVESGSDYFFNASYDEFNSNRLELSEQVINSYSDSDILLFPAGFFELETFSNKKIKNLSRRISDIIREKDSSCVACFGIDCRNSYDQLAIAADKYDILAIGRKFYPTADEKGAILTATSFDTTEIGYRRNFSVKNKSIYLAVCYDCFGIRHRNIANPGYDIILTLAHRFHKKGEGPSGDVDFARKGFAGASQHWGCPVFGTATFFDREVSPSWPSGVLWNNPDAGVKSFKYTDNEISPIACKKININPESAICREFLF